METNDCCAICLEDPMEPFQLSCKHTFCSKCVLLLCKTQLKHTCPMCRGTISYNDLSTVLHSDWAFSALIQAQQKNSFFEKENVFSQAEVHFVTAFSASSPFKKSIQVKPRSAKWH